jgi:4-amino-4-deoxy-L-arabinose transferase-like glycosyltransferase
METISRPDRQQASPALASTWEPALGSPWWIAAIALVLRLAWILIGHTYKFKAAPYNFNFGWEMGSIGASIASGRGFGNPFGPLSGPTAWEPPIYPYGTALVFSAFGIYSKASAIVLLSLNSAFSALTCIPIFFIARRIFSRRVATVSAWAWALLPNVIAWCTRWVWETCLSALLLACAVWLALALEELEGFEWWCLFGLLWGAIALNGTSILAFLPAAGLWAWYRRARCGKRSLAAVVLASLVFLASISPWLVRDYKTFGRFIFIRDNFGAELRLGNGNGASGTIMDYLGPPQDADAMRQFLEMGELEYVALRKQEALDYIREDYSRFAGLSLKRLLYFWAGAPKTTGPWWLIQAKNSLFLASSVLAFWGLVRALGQHKPGAWLLFWLILLYPMVYYFVYPGARYRQPIEPVMTILAVFLLLESGQNPATSPPDQS